jgi:2-dehydro-3-deoxygalactonokinase
MPAAHDEAVMIGVDWGTTSLRAFRMAGDGAVLQRRERPLGIMQVEDADFAGALRAVVGDWLEDDPEVLLSGMIGSRQGWREAPYISCPAGALELAAGLVEVPFAGARVRLVPGLSGRDASGVPEVMRGEETQLVGAMAWTGGDAVVCLPGTHSKWVHLAGGRIARFTTHMTGEAFAALRGHTILGRMMQEGPTDEAAFDRGVARSAEPGGLLHHLFGVRALGLFGGLEETAAASYLSGLLIGHEVRAALPGPGPVHLIGADALCGLYGRALSACGAAPLLSRREAAPLGLFAIANSK